MSIVKRGNLFNEVSLLALAVIKLLFIIVFICNLRLADSAY